MGPSNIIKNFEFDVYQQMAIEIGLSLSKEEERDLSIGLLREWWITSTQALVDTIGSEAALRRLKPYFVHAGKAGGLVFQEMSGIQSNDPMASENGMGLAFEVMMEGKWGPISIDEDGNFTADFFDCATLGLNKEVCISCCDYSTCNCHKEISPAYEMRLIKSIGFGDSECGWITYKEGAKQPIPSREGFRVLVDHRPSYVPSEELKEYLCHAWSGEFWILVTRAFIDSIGSEKALERLRFYMRHSGLSVGIQMSNRFKGIERKVVSIVDIVKMVQSLHERKVVVQEGADRAECIVEECPFASGAPQEICHQYEAFFNGICEAIDPSYEFSYDRMMTKGDQTCHWTIRKKKDHADIGASPESTLEPPLEILKIRLARGELSLEEYRELKKELLE